MKKLLAFLTLLLLGACAVDRVLVNVEKARTAGMEGEACCNDGADTAAAAAVAK